MNGFSLSSASQCLCVVVVAMVATACASTGAVPRPFPMPTRAPTTASATAPPGASAVPAEGEPGAPGVTANVPSTATAAADPDDLTPASIPTELPLGVIDTALALLGSPYRNGGSTPDGFDCSGFTQWVFSRHGVVLPRESRQQYEHGADVDDDAVVAGDLIFFTTVAPGASHVAIALDEDRFVHAPSARGVVRIERRSSAYWRRRYIGARRIAAN